MSAKVSAPSRHLLTAMVRVSVLGALLFTLAVLGSMACEDNGIGRPCDVGADAGASQAVYNNHALECPSRTCLKPVNDNPCCSSEPPTCSCNTGPYCSAYCSKDSDCDGQKRDNGDNGDFRCQTGYACGVAFVVGPLCCQKLCLCKDFLGTGLLTPQICDPKLNNGRTACQETP
jgi:hypothetical protein